MVMHAQTVDRHFVDKADKPVDALIRLTSQLTLKLGRLQDMSGIVWGRGWSLPMRPARFAARRQVFA
jgi:hypothetical protein